MNMNRIVTNTPSSSWTAPAGVTKITISIIDAYSNLVATSTVVTVVPNTTYTITRVDYYAAGVASTFGSIYSWTGAHFLNDVITVSWVE